MELHGFVRIQPPVATIYHDGVLVCRDANEYEVRLLMVYVYSKKVDGEWEVEFDGVRQKINNEGRIKPLPSGFMDVTYKLAIYNLRKEGDDLSDENKKFIDKLIHNPGPIPGENV